MAGDVRGYAYPRTRVQSNIIKSLMFAGVTAVSAQIAIPLGFTPVPITLQVFGVLLSGLVLGSRWGAISQMQYLALGAMGFPVFAGLSGGPTAFFGPFGGLSRRLCTRGVHRGMGVRADGGRKSLRRMGCRDRRCLRHLSLRRIMAGGLVVDVLLEGPHAPCRLGAGNRAVHRGRSAEGDRGFRVGRRGARRPRADPLVWRVRALRLRGHHILCLHGWRGIGYSADFTANMHSICDRLKSSPDMLVQVLDSPDDICASCPHVSNARCVRSGDESEDRISRKDAAILHILDLAPGDRLTARELFTLASERFGEDGLRGVCGSCRWFGFGWCEQGIRDRVMLRGPADTT